MRVALTAAALLVSLVACRAGGAPTDPGFDEMESTLNSVEAEVTDL